MKDHNTKFFHASTIIRRKRNEITQLKIDGRMVSGVPSLKSAINSYFSGHFTQDSTPMLDFDLGNHVVLTDEQNRFLEENPSRA